MEKLTDRAIPTYMFLKVTKRGSNSSWLTLFSYSLLSHYFTSNQKKRCHRNWFTWSELAVCHSDIQVQAGSCEWTGKEESTASHSCIVVRLSILARNSRMQPGCGRSACSGIKLWPCACLWCVWLCGCVWVRKWDIKPALTCVVHSCKSSALFCISSSTPSSCRKRR